MCEERPHGGDRFILHYFAYLFVKFLFFLTRILHDFISFNYLQNFDSVIETRKENKELIVKGILNKENTRLSRWCDTKSSVFFSYIQRSKQSKAC